MKQEVKRNMLMSSLETYQIYKLTRSENFPTLARFLHSGGTCVKSSHRNTYQRENWAELAYFKIFNIFPNLALIMIFRSCETLVMCPIFPLDVIKPL